jgi:hypothetical protein
MIELARKDPGQSARRFRDCYTADFILVWIDRWHRHRSPRTDPDLIPSISFQIERNNPYWKCFPYPAVNTSKMISSLQNNYFCRIFVFPNRPDFEWRSLCDPIISDLGEVYRQVLYNLSTSQQEQITRKSDFNTLEIRGCLGVMLPSDKSDCLHMENSNQMEPSSES